MRVALVTWGARGDYQPYLALARAFADAGHEVKLGSPPLPGFAASAAEQRVPFVPLGPIGEDRPIEEWVPRLLAIMRDEAGLVQMYEQCLDVVRWADILVCHFFQPAGRMAAESVGCPFVTGTLVPSQLPSQYYPPTKVPNLGRWSNWLIWKLVGASLNRYCSGINVVRRRVGLPPLRDLVGDGFYSSELNLVAVSPNVAPPPPDWAPRHRQTGYWFLDRQDWQAPREVEDFVSQDPKPIAIGFGSMVTPNSEGVLRVIVEAVKQSGVRAVIEPGWANLGGDDLPSTMLTVRGVPHYWLFPRTAAVVHHGGAGTTAAALRAGVPSVIVPHVFDQHYWAETATRLGVATPPIALRDLSATRLARAITMATKDPGLRERSARLGEIICREDGVGTAVHLVESYMNGALGQRSTLSRVGKSLMA